MAISDFAKAAWGAYSEAVGGTTFDGRPLPLWEDLGDRQKAGWAKAADAVIDLYEDDRDDEEDEDEGKEVDFSK